jgi:hypothetical protein
MFTWGHRLGSEVATFALAASLSTVTKILNVRIVRDLNMGLPTQWAALQPLDRRGIDGTAKRVSRSQAPKANSKRAIFIRKEHHGLRSPRNRKNGF